MALFSSSPKTVTKVMVVKSPAPDDKEPEKRPIIQMVRAPNKVRFIVLFFTF